MDSNPLHDKVRYKLRFTNDRSHSCVFAVEPWGDTYEMESGKTFDVIATGPSENSVVDVIESDGSIAVYAWSGATISIFDGSYELGAGTSPREPAP